MKIRHAVGLSRARKLPDGSTALFTTCGIWVTAERCDEALRATCETCKERMENARSLAWITNPLRNPSSDNTSN